jgi:hypothetical protein
MDAIVAREVGKPGFNASQVNEAVTDLIPGDRHTWTPTWRQRPKMLWQTAVGRNRLSPFANNVLPFALNLRGAAHIRK